ncbi:hypothetical protein ACFC26_16040 [Kitasatospora purpeofusca]|uniref:hypothetical protein n=1 Tax=Kitasatospora purpeofusca TaxID=67352 RepID=UPI0035D67E35
MRIHLVAYTTTAGSKGVARVPSDRSRPSWAEVAKAIPGYRTGTYLGLAPESAAVPMFTLRYERDGIGKFVKKGTAQAIESLGAALMQQETVFNVEVRNEDGIDVTFDFACFA